MAPWAIQVAMASNCGRALPSQIFAWFCGMETPPLRIPFGSDAVAILRAAAEADIASIDRWRELSESTDFDGTRAFDVSALPGL